MLIICLCCFFCDLRYLFIFIYVIKSLMQDLDYLFIDILQVEVEEKENEEYEEIKRMMIKFFVKLDVLFNFYFIFKLVSYLFNLFIIFF